MMTMGRDRMAGWWPVHGTARNGAGRRGWAGTMLMLAATLAVALVSYSMSMSVSAERTAVAKLERQNAALARELKSLEAEYRVRMRLPLLERWNRDVLGLRPIEAGQFLDSPLLLARYGEQPGDRLLAPSLAILRNAPLADPVAAAKPALRIVAADQARPGEAGSPAIDPELVAAVSALGDRGFAEPPAGAPVLTSVALVREPGAVTGTEPPPTSAVSR